MKLWKVGELARQTGLTVRTLHHYDEIGLLRPSHRSAAGHRLYGAEDLARLLQILSLRQLGLSLEEIRECVTRPEFSLQRILDTHVARLRERIALQQKLCDRLDAVAGHLRSAETVSVEELLQTMEAITMFEKYYTEEQLRTLEERHRQIGEDRIREVEAEWPVLIAEVRVEMDRGTDPANETVQRLAARWQSLVAEFTGGDPGIAKSVGNLYREEPQARERVGLDPALFDYIGRAMAAMKKAE
ncbi:MAG TPA: MerR family transcriptional regulator [Thermoanaerobaculia bacterium]|nr:MerR family transcriptional regulator [Thermoanaerobaculia bacterium]